MRNNRGFTIIELAVVIAIIAILSTIGFISYASAQKTARDSKRKIDVNAIVSAYQLHYVDTKTWKFSNTELKKIDPSTPAGGEGWLDTADSTKMANSGGSGFFNFETGSYLISMAHALSFFGYLPNQPLDPSIPNNRTGQVIKSGVIVASQYIKYPCTGNASIFVAAKLENGPAPVDTDLNNMPTECLARYNTTAVSMTMNYVVGIK